MAGRYKPLVRVAQILIVRRLESFAPSQLTSASLSSPKWGIRGNVNAIPG